MSSITVHSTVGKNTTAATSRVQNHAGPGPNSQPPASKASSDGGTRLRRRLSKIFHTRQGARAGWVAASPSIRLARRSGHARQQPAGKLPVAAYPAMAPAGLDGVTGRMLFDEFDIGHQRRTRIAAFQQVVTEDEILRKASIDGLTKRVHIVDALADERPLPEHILVDIRYLARVGIDARLAREQFGEARLACTGQADRRARLQDRVAFDDASLAGIVDRPIERMRDGCRSGCGPRRAAVACRYPG